MSPTSSSDEEMCVSRPEPSRPRLRPSRPRMKIWP